MPLEPGQSLSHYRVAEKIGEGGMGAVYRAEDTRLGRDVAIKVLPDEVARDPDRVARFQREARSLAALNHPNIAAIYGLEEAGEARFLVLELVSGETLEERIARGPLPREEALGIARQIAEAFKEAHTAGILHRDLKPSNVKITADLKVKVLDFGLAKPFLPDAPGGSSGLTRSPTLTMGATAVGVLLGTAAYMSPEQARGHPVDRRADIWAFGCVLYEMLAGAPPFIGSTISDTLASVLKEEPDWSRLPGDLAPAARRLLRRTLAKDPAARLHDISDARIEIDEALVEPAESAEVGAVPRGAAARRPALGRLLPWALAGLASLVAIWIALQGVGRAPAPAARLTASILPPPEVSFDTSRGLALSPDGKRLAFPAKDGSGRVRLWIRSLDRPAARPLDGTDGAAAPFWSPDGRRIGFFADGKLRKIEVETGLLESIADAPAAYGGAWSETGDIVFSPGFDRPLERVPASGGTPQPVTQKEKTSDAHLWPSFLPDGRHFLFLNRVYGSEAELGQLRVGSLDGSPSRLLFSSNSSAQYAPPGYLIWWHGGNLRAQRFDADRQELQGEPFVLVSGARFDPRAAVAVFSVSRTGILVYQEGGSLAGNELVWLDRSGREIGTVGDPGSLYSPKLSPDGTRVALDRSDETNRGDIWLIDVNRGSGTRLSSFPEDDSVPVWSPDGAEVAFFSAKGGGHTVVYVRSTRDGSDARLLIADPAADLEPADWPRTDLMLLNRSKDDDVDIFLCSIPDRKIRPFLATPFREWDAQVSPDGRHVAYTSDETGSMEVYVGTFPEPGERWRVSADGGRMPKWHPGGVELYYVTLDSRLMAVSLKGRNRGGDRPAPIGAPEMLFRVDLKEHRLRQFDTHDGTRFLANRNVSLGAGVPLTLVVHWTEP